MYKAVNYSHATLATIIFLDDRWLRTLSRTPLNLRVLRGPAHFVVIFILRFIFQASYIIKIKCHNHLPGRCPRPCPNLFDLLDADSYRASSKLHFVRQNRAEYRQTVIDADMHTTRKAYKDNVFQTLCKTECGNRTKKLNRTILKWPTRERYLYKSSRSPLL
jgi:hypothetical protein